MSAQTHRTFIPSPPNTGDVVEEKKERIQELEDRMRVEMPKAPSLQSGTHSSCRCLHWECARTDPSIVLCDGERWRKGSRGPNAPC